MCQVEVLVGPVSVGLLVLPLVEPGELGVSGGHEVVERVEVRDALVAEDKQLVVRLLEDGHPLAVDLEFLAVELDLGLEGKKS